MPRDCQEEAWFTAIEQGDFETVQAYHAAMSGVVDSRGLTSLMKAAMGCNVGIIQLLMGSGLRKKDNWGRTALMFAAMSGSSVASEMLISTEATITDNDGMTALMYAAFHGNVEIVHMLLPYEQGYVTKQAAILQLGTHNYEIGSSMTALMIATLVQNIACVELLSEFEAGRTDCNGETALYKAVEAGYVPAIRVLAPIESRLRSIYGYSPLYLAVQSGLLEAIELLAPYEDDDGRYGPTEETALMVTVLRQDKAAAELLAPTLHSEFSKEGLTALIIAARENLPAMCQLLIPYEFGLVTQQGHKTALMVAAELGNVECVRLLMEHEAGMRTEAGETALMLAARRGQLECVTILAPYECCAVNKNYQTALMLATIAGHVSVVMSLVEHERRIQNNRGQTALMLAVLHQNVQLVSLLAPYESGIFDMQHQTALMIAANSNEYNLVAILVDYEAGLTDCDARTALMFAAEKNYVDLIPLLSDKECGRLDRFGRSALFIASQNSNIRIIKELVSKEKRMVTTRRFRVEQNTNIYIALGSTALIYTILYDKLDIAQILVQHEHGVVDNTGRCALHYAIDRKNTNLIKLLIPYEYSISDIDGNTPLMLLTKTGIGQFTPGVVNKLLNISSDGNTAITTENKNGETALSLAITHTNEITLCVLYGLTNLRFPFYNPQGISLLELCEKNPNESILQIFCSYFVTRLSFTTIVMECMCSYVLSTLLQEYQEEEENCTFILLLLDYFFEYLFSDAPDDNCLHSPLESPRLIAFNEHIKGYLEPLEGSCNVCYNDLAIILCLPCRHVATCKDCWQRIENSKTKRDAPRCPICRAYVTCSISLNQVDDKLLCSENMKKGSISEKFEALQNETGIDRCTLLPSEVLVMPALKGTYHAISYCERVPEESSDVPEIDINEDEESTVWNSEIEREFL